MSCRCVLSRLRCYEGTRAERSGQTERGDSSLVWFARTRRHRLWPPLNRLRSWTKLFYPKASKITITFKNEPDRKSQVSALVISSYYISQLQTTRRPMGTLVNLGLTFGRVVKWKSSLNFVGIIVNDVISTFVRLYRSFWGFCSN